MNEKQTKKRLNKKRLICVCGINHQFRRVGSLLIAFKPGNMK